MIQKAKEALILVKILKVVKPAHFNVLLKLIQDAMGVIHTLIKNAQ